MSDNTTNIIYDRKFRSIAFQAFILIAVVLVFSWFASNASNNLSSRGDSIGFGFLNNPAGFSILPTLGTYLLDYDPGKSTYWDVYLIGIINTAVIALTGIIATTILGFVIGIMRLSKNIVLNGFATIYVEMFRNIPLLIHLFFWYFAVLRAVPGKRDKIDLFGSAVGLNKTGLYMPKVLFLEGSGILLIVIILAIIISFITTGYGNRVRKETGKQIPILRMNLSILILSPLAVFIIYYLFSGAPLGIEYPEFKTDGPKLKRGFVSGVGISVYPEMIALWSALVLYTASFIAEIVRAGITAIHSGQTEASYAVGMRPGPTLRLIIIPQALRVIVPPITSQYLNLTKNSSLAVAIAYPELVSVFAGTALNQVGQEIEIIFMMALVYLTFSLGTSAFMNWFNYRVKLVEK